MQTPCSWLAPANSQNHATRRPEPPAGPGSAQGGRRALPPPCPSSDSRLAPPGRCCQQAGPLSSTRWQLQAFAGRHHLQDTLEGCLAPGAAKDASRRRPGPGELRLGPAPSLL
ncbi:interleukin-17 receptor C [Platysternon megacephalum]|uniref:Interleukin-17 receptor C n=1 Tax=Platysternon megacephalum TaxID=55544 RepID=A0A4D9DLK7_9SAUR|nr:interleukin-17 receptor C [Platysternon megacephalum]